MKTLSMLRFLAIPLLLAAGIVHADVVGGVDPNYVRVKVFESRVSLNADCSSPITVFRNDAAGYQDMTHNPTLGAGAIPNGTYNCVMLRMSDYIHYTPVSATSHCSVGTDYVSDVGHDSIAIAPDGTTQSLGPAGTENILWLYIRTGATIAQNNNAFIPTQGIPLLTPLVVNGDGAHTMVFDFSGRIGDDSGSCGCDAPTLSFR